MKQKVLFSDGNEPADRNSSTFVDNMKLAVHRWFRFSAGFSAQWAETVVTAARRLNPDTRVFDPFAGSGTTLIASQQVGVPSFGVEAHPFVARIANAKLLYRSNPGDYLAFARGVLQSAKRRRGACDPYPVLIRNCYRDEVLTDLDRLRVTFEQQHDGSSAAELTWLTIVAILRKTSHVGTANWQYVLPRKTKKNPIAPFHAFESQIQLVYRDMVTAADDSAASASIAQADARTCEGIPTDFATLVITSPPYPNNFDYADATRLEMTFMREIDGWADLHGAVRRHLIRSCSQHVPVRAVDLNEVLSAPELSPIRPQLTAVCDQLSEIRLTKGGKKTYHLMVACYFLDLARVWGALRRVCDAPSEVCFVIGDSAPYGVYVPAMDWLGKIAENAGFSGVRFEKLRDRNIKWKNRKHRVPLTEGRLWVNG